jgi:hypothetical protein
MCPIADTTCRDGAELAAIGSGFPAAGDDEECRMRAEWIRWCVRLGRLFGGIGKNGDIHGQLHRGQTVTRRRL